MRCTRKIPPVVLTALASLLASATCNKTNTEGKAAGLPPVASFPSPPASAVAAADHPAPAAGVPLVPVPPEMFAPQQAASPPTADPKAKIDGTIVLSDAIRTRVARGAVMFITARRAGGLPGPGSMLAAQKLTADTFPMPFSLSERDAMIPGIPFEGPVTITVRVDQDGDPMTRRKGDVYGQATNVKVGARAVKLALDKVQEDDQTLPGGPGAMADRAMHPM